MVQLGPKTYPFSYPGQYPSSLHQRANGPNSPSLATKIQSPAASSTPTSSGLGLLVFVVLRPLAPVSCGLGILPLLGVLFFVLFVLHSYVLFSRHFTFLQKKDVFCLISCVWLATANEKVHEISHHLLLEKKKSTQNL